MLKQLIEAELQAETERIRPILNRLKNVCDKLNYLADDIIKFNIENLAIKSKFNDELGYLIENKPKEIINTCEIYINNKQYIPLLEGFNNSLVLKFFNFEKGNYCLQGVPENSNYHYFLNNGYEKKHLENYLSDLYLDEEKVISKYFKNWLLWKNT